MNICLFNNFYPPKTGGSAHYTQDLANELVKKGHQVTVVTAKLSEIQPDFVVERGVRVHRLKNFCYPSLSIAHGFDLRWTLLPQNFIKIFEILKGEKIELIHTCGQFFDLVVPSAFFSLVLGIPSVVSIHTRVEHTNRFYNALLGLLDRTLVKLLLFGFNRIVVLDKPCFEYVKDRYCVNDWLIPFVVTGVRGLEKKVVKKKRKKIVLWVSHITNLKDPSPLIRAIPSVVKEHKDARFIFVGKICNDKPLKLASKLGVKDYLEFTGELPYEEVMRLYKNALIETHDLNLGLGMGSVTLEAMGAGLCVLTAARKDNFFDNTPKHMKEVVFVRKDDPKDIADKICYLLSRQKTAVEIGMRAAEFVRKHFMWKDVATKLEKVYLELLNEG